HAMPISARVVGAVVKTFPSRDHVRLNQVVIHQLIAVTQVDLNNIDGMPARPGLGQRAVEDSLPRRKVMLQGQSSITSIKHLRQRKKFIYGQRPVINQLPLRLSAFGEVVEFFLLLE